MSGGQGAFGASLRRGGQGHRPLEERRRPGEPGAGLGPARRPLELRGDVLVRSRGRGGQVPHPMFRIGAAVRRLGERPVCRAAVLR